MPLVTDDGFKTDRWRRLAADAPLDAAGDGSLRVIVPLERLDEALAAGVEPLGVDLPGGDDLGRLVKRLHSVALIALRFPTFADGRGFSLARRLRDLGYAGRLRAAGHVIPDQWAFLRACGIDEAEIDQALADRQPEASWQRAAQEITGSYQHRLRTPRPGSIARSEFARSA